MRRLLVVVMFVAMFTAVLSAGGCGTWSGMGEDVETVGEAMQ